MPIYPSRRGDCGFRVVVWVRGKSWERKAPTLALARELEAEMRRQFSARRPKRVRVEKSPDGTYALKVGEDRAAPVVYFIRQGAAGPIKIGFTSDLKARFNSFRCASAEPLYLLGTLPGGRLLERALHAGLADSRYRDGEWFRPTSEVLALLAELFPETVAPRGAVSEASA